MTSPLPPDPPVNLNSVPGSTTAIITWDPAPTGGPVDHFAVDGYADAYVDTYLDSYSPVSHTVVTADLTQALLSGLTNGLPYTVTVTARGPGGISAQSDPIVVTPSSTLTVLPDPNAPPYVPPIDPTLLPPAPVYPPEVDATTVAAPVLGVLQAPADVTGRPVVPAGKVGHVQLLYLERTDNGQILYLLPSRGGLWLTAFDLGYPAVQAVTSPWPDTDGMLDYTHKYNDRNVVINLLAEPWRGVDANGVLQPSAAWQALARAWSSLDYPLRLHYQLTGQRPMWMDVRSDQYQAPYTSSQGSTDRFTIGITWGLYDAAGMSYLEVPDGYPEDPARPGWFQVIASAAAGSGAFSFGGGTSFAGGAGGMTFGGGTSFAGGAGGMSFGGGSAYGGSVVSVPAETVGSRRSAPVITISGDAVTAPEVNVYGSGGTALRATLQFSSGLVLTAADVMLIDVPNRRVVRNPDRFGNGESLYKYFATGVVDWRNFVLDPADDNAFSFGASSAGTNAQAAFSYRATYV